MNKHIKEEKTSNQQGTPKEKPDVPAAASKQ